MIRFPHFAFELTRLARAPRPHAVRFLFVAVLLGFAALIWPWNSHTASDLFIGSSRIFTVFFQAEMVLAIVVVPALVAPAIPAEREAHTLELLVGCPEPEGKLVSGKLASLAVLVLAVLSAGFPVAFASTLLGGVPLARAATACVHVAMTAAFATCVAIRCSLAWQGSIAATVAAVMIHAGTVVACALVGGFAYVMVLARMEVPVAVFLLICSLIVGARWRHTGEFPSGCAGALLLFLMLFGFFAISAVGHHHATRSFSPEYVLSAICPWWAYSEDSLSGQRLPWNLLVSAWGVHAVACVLVLRGTFRNADSNQILLGTRATRLDLVSRQGTFRSEWRERQRQEIEAKRAAGISAPPPRPAFSRLHIHPRADVMNPSKVNPYLPVGRDPVYWKETSWSRFPALNRLRFIAVMLAWLVAINGAFAAASGSRVNCLEGLSMEILLISVLVAAVGAATLAPERENGTMSILLSTGYPATRIVLGKALAALRWSRSIFIPVGLHLLLGIGLLGAYGTAVTVVVIGATATVLGLSIGVSGATRHPRLAFALTALAVIALWTIPGIAADRWLEAAPLRVVNPFVAIDDILIRARHFTSFPDPRQLSSFAAATLLAAFLPPVFAALSLERQVRA